MGRDYVVYNFKEVKNILLSLTYLVGIGELILATFFWVTHSKNEIRKVMALLAFSTGMWVILSAIFAYRVTDQTSLIISQIIYVFGVLLVTSFIHLSLIYPFPLVRLDRYHGVLLYLPALIFSVISVTSKAIIQSTTGDTNVAGDIVGGPVYPMYNAYLSIVYLLGIIFLVLQRRRMDGFHRRNLGIVIWSFILGGLPAVYLDLLTPFFHLPNPNYLVGNLASGIWLGATAYIVLRK